MFFNILTNAFKFTPSGGRICMTAEEKDHTAEVRIFDNGRGISPEFLDKLFNNFFQVPDQEAQNTGYGIGLALSKHIVKLHKGTIRVESELAIKDKEGSTSFVISLLQGNSHFEHLLQEPEIKDSKPAEPEETEVKLYPKIVSLQQEGEEKHFTILVAEDNEEVRRLIYDIFIGDYQVLECADGLIAWETATSHIPDLIISDVMMPEIDGFALCAKLKTDERTSHIPVILPTALTSQADQVSGLENGADVYITKPYNSKLLHLNVRNLSSARQKMRQEFSKNIIALSGDAVAQPKSETAAPAMAYIRFSIYNPKTKTCIFVKK